MRWKGREQSDNVEDRRGISPKAAMGGGGLLVLVIIGVAFLLDPKLGQQLLQQAAIPQPPVQDQRADPKASDDEAEFIRVVLRDTEKVWTQLFDQHVDGGRYQPPQLVMFSGTVQSRCGIASREVGPFYCPADEKVYIDPSFFVELAERHKASGDFAAAYVIAHEVAHHVQKLVGYHERVEAMRQRGGKLEANRASVRLELQADYLAGVWAHHAHKNYQILEANDIDEAIRAANRIGDDTLQKETMGYSIPERFTHGTSRQRMHWFRKGFQSGDFNGCDELFELDYDAL